MEDENPYQASVVTSPLQLDPIRRRRWVSAVYAVVIGYYVLSSLTLPLANSLWIGEIPVFGLVQIPKSNAFYWIRHALVALMQEFGMSRGSHSPDLIASEPWAFAILFVMPALVVLAITRIFQTFKERRLWVCGLLVAATIDAFVTMWFEHTSSLSFF